MSRNTSSVIFGVPSQTIEHRVIEGRPTSATFDVLLDEAGDDDTSEFSGTATVDSVDTTVDVACGASSAEPRQVKLTSTSGIVTGRKYLLSEGSKQEWVQPVEIVSGDYLMVRHRLINDYTTAATFAGTTVIAAIDNTWVAADENLSDQIDNNPSYRVRWEILVGGSTLVQYSFFDVVRAPVGHGVDLDDLNARAPGLVDSCPLEYRTEQGRPLIEAAWRKAQARLSAMKIDTDALRDDLITDELTILSALTILARGGWRPSTYDSHAEYVQDTQADYDRFIEQHFLVSQPHKMATGTSGSTDVVRHYVIGK